MPSVAVSKYRPPPRPQDRRPHPPRRGDARPTLIQFVVLSMCLHALAILLFGAPSGGSRQGRAMWGALQVDLEDSYREVLPGLRIDRALEALRKEAAPRPARPRPAPRAAAPPKAAAPPVRLNPAKEIALPAAPPAPRMQEAKPAAPPSPPVAPAAPAVESTPPVPELVVPPMMERLAPAPKLDKLQTFTIPPPTQNQVVAPPPVQTRPAPVAPVEIKPLPTLPRVEATPLPPMAAPAPLETVAPAAVEMKPLAPMTPIESKPLPSLPSVERLRIEPAPLPALPVERTRVETPPEVPAVPTVPRVESPPVEVPSIPVEKPPVMEAPALPAVPATRAVPVSPPVPAAPAVPRTDALPAAPTMPSAPPAATPVERPPAPPSPREPSAVTPPAAPAGEAPSLFHPPAGDAGRGAPDADYDPTKPRELNLDAMRSRAGQLARQGTGNRALLAFPMPPVPREKSKLEKGIEKAWKPDCKTAYSSLGLAAVVPLIANEFGEGNCRW